MPELRTAGAPRHGTRSARGRSRRQAGQGQKNSATSSKPPSSDIVKPPPKRANGKRGKLTITHARNWQVYRRPDRLRHLYQGRYKSFPIEGEKGNRMTKDRWERLSPDYS